MKNILSKSFKIFKSNILLIMPFLLYCFVLIIAIDFILTKGIFLYPKIILSILIILLTAANLAGWLFINKSAFNDFNEDDEPEEKAIKTIKSLKSYFSGVGEYFIRTLSGLFIYIIFYFISFFAAAKLCLMTAGYPVIIDKIKYISNFKTVNEISEFINTFSAKDILIFKYWFSVFSVLGLLLSFLGILYLTILFFDKTNIFKSFIKMFQFFFKNLFLSVGIILFMFCINIMMNILILIPILNSFAILALSLYLNYYIILVFCFYNEKTKDNSNNRTECIGENIAGD